MSEPETKPDEKESKEPSAADAAGSGPGAKSSPTGSGPAASKGEKAKDADDEDKGSGEAKGRAKLASSLDVFDSLPAKSSRASSPSLPGGASSPAISTDGRKPPPAPPSGKMAPVSKVPPPPTSKPPPAPPSSKAAPVSKVPPPPSSKAPPSKAPPPPPSGKAPPPAPAEIDFDDDDDEDTASIARASLQSGGALSTVPPPTAAPPVSRRPPTPSVPPPSAAPQSMPQVVAAAPSAAAQAPSSGGGTNIALVLVGAVVIFGLIAVIVVLLLPRDGTMMVTVATPDNQPIDQVSIFVDGQQRCETSPCRVANLSPGTHIVRASAPGYQSTAPQAVAVKGGSEAVTNLILGGKGGGTGLKVSAGDAKGLQLTVDGKEIGELPQSLPDLAPGEHSIKVSGNDTFVPYEKTITIRAGELSDLELKLKVAKGAARIKAGRGAAGAEVYLVSGAEKRRLEKLPITVGIKTAKNYRLVAKKKGYSDYRRDVVFEDGEPEKTFVIDMLKIGETPPPAPGPVAEKGKKGDPAKKGEGKDGKGAEKAAEMGTINMNSLPASNVILNGRPLGQTPKMGVKVKPGPVTVVFVHPEHGRKVKGTVVKPGGTSTVLVRFP